MKNSGKLLRSLQKELTDIEKKETALENTALGAKSLPLKSQLESKIPVKVYEGLESAFCKAFSMVFDQGRSLIEKSYNKDELAADHSIRDYALNIKGGRRELKQLKKAAQRSELINLAVTTVEGVGLGAMGIGLPDIVLFISTLLKGVYETALSYGFDYVNQNEQYFILKLLSASLQTGEDWQLENKAVDSLIFGSPHEVSASELEFQMKKTASVFTVDMLLLKFVQGMPVVGMLAGAANPIYYRKILRYVRLKYQKRYVLSKLRSISAVVD